MWVLNQLHVIGPQPRLTADLLLAELDRGLADAPHRRAMVLDEPTGRRLAEQLAGRPGWQIGSLLVMPLVTEPLEPPPGIVREVDDATLRRLDLQVNEQDRDLPPGVAAKLVAGRAALRGAVPGTRRFIGAREGADACTATLYSDGETAQVEAVNTLPGQRGHGLAAATVSHAAREALAGGHELVFILCDGTDGPVPLYAGLGFSPLGRYWTFTRPA